MRMVLKVQNSKTREKPPLTLARAERLFELVRGGERGASDDATASTLRAIANGGGRGYGGNVDVEADAARWLTAATREAFGDASDDDAFSPRTGTKTGTKRNLSSRFDPAGETNDEEETTSAPPPAKRRKLTMMERLTRRVAVGAASIVSSPEIRKIDGTRYDKAACAIVDESLERLGRVDLACVRAMELSVTSTGRGYGFTPAGLETLRMVLNGGTGVDYKFKVDADARAHLNALIKAEEEHGPEVLMLVDKRRRLARALARLSNLGRPPQYRVIDHVKYDEKICYIADVAMHRFGKIDASCATAMYASAQDGGSHWGVTEIELRSLRMIADGGVGELSYVVLGPAKRVLEDAIAKEELKAEQPKEAATPPPSRTRGRILSPLRKLVRRKEYRYIDSLKYDEKACSIAEECMERIGRVDLKCAKEIHESLDGALFWGITSIEYVTIKLILDGGRDDVLFICDDDARAYLLDVLGSKAQQEAANVTPPPTVTVHHQQAPATELQSALKVPPPSALKQSIKSMKRTGVKFTPAKRFETRTYIPSPTSGNSEHEDSSDEDVEETPDEVVIESEEEDAPPEMVKTKTHNVRTRVFHLRETFIVKVFMCTLQMFIEPVTVIDTIAACLITLAVLLIVHFFVIAVLVYSMAPPAQV